MSTRPHHVRVGEQVKPADEPPDLSDVLCKIDDLLYLTGKETEQR